MRIICKALQILLPLSLLLISSPLSSEELSDYTLNNQPVIISSLLKTEKNIGVLKQIIVILNRIDDTYGSLYERLSGGGAITVFFDPAHGKWNNGRWEGESTGRVSCTGLTEEYYSIRLSRELYKLLDANRFIRVETTKDFHDVIKGKNEIYSNIPFTETVKLARESNSFLIVSEHLNNISTILKAGGLINIPGIHITESKWGTSYLTYIKDTHKGFLTLYNKYDATNISRQYSLELKKILVENGMKANNWKMGAVPDDRFCYFVDFPVSVIFESGFISNPEEEVFLAKPENQLMIARAQYEALMETLRQTFGVDISGSKPRQVKTPPKEFLELLKLSRIAIFYIKQGDTDKAIRTISLMSKNYPGHNEAFIGPYREAAAILNKAQRYYHLSKAYKRKKDWRRSRKYALHARRILYEKPLFATLNENYRKDFIKLGILHPTKNETIAKIIPKEAVFTGKKAGKIYRAGKTTPVILAIEDGQNLETAVARSLNPNTKQLEAITKSLKKACITRVKRVSGRSKTGRRIYYWKKYKNRVTFVPGIYIVRFDNNLTVRSIARVSKVPLIPWKYQNHQYLKNSCFSPDEKDRSL